MDIENRKESSRLPVEWQGDLSDDCVVEWAGLMLRAEEMNKGYWWWAVCDLHRNGVTISSSNSHDIPSENGEQARQFAETTAKRYIARIIEGVVARFMIKKCFIVTGRGLIVLGHMINGEVCPGNTIELSIDDELDFRKVIGIEMARTLSPIDDIGLRIECKDREEMEYLKQNIVTDNPYTIFKF